MQVQQVGRRQVTRAALWAAPSIVAVSAAPAFATSPASGPISMVITDGVAGTSGGLGFARLQALVAGPADANPIVRFQVYFYLQADVAHGNGNDVQTFGRASADDPFPAPGPYPRVPASGWADFSAGMDGGTYSRQEWVANEWWNAGTPLVSGDTVDWSVTVPFNDRVAQANTAAIVAIGLGWYDLHGTYAGTSTQFSQAMPFP